MELEKEGRVWCACSVRVFGFCGEKHNKDVYKDDNDGSTSHIIHVPIRLWLKTNR